MGYHLAGFDVTGVDINPQPRYPFAFVQADAMTFPLDGFDAIHASPPCQDHSSLARTSGIHGTGWMLSATIERLAASGVPYVVENVPGANMPGALVLCGSEFGLEDGSFALKRHRLFISNVFLVGAGGCFCRSSKNIIGIYGDLRTNDRGSGRGPRRMRAGVDRARWLMGMPWASGPELTQAIPPAYTRFIGEQLLATIPGRTQT
jgi:DNA (cytosine-5)-methyltransferase 1